MTVLRPLILLAALAAPNAAAESRIDLAPAAIRCGQEEGARAACLGVIADTRMVAMERRIAALAAAGQAGDPGALVERARALERAQARWRETVESRCGARRGALARQRCRLDAALAREAALAPILARAAAPSRGPAAPGVMLPPSIGLEFRPGLHGPVPLLRFAVPLEPDLAPR